MGAQLDLLATYSSRSTGSTEVQRLLRGPPRFRPRGDRRWAVRSAQLMAVLLTRSLNSQPAKSIYHDQLSTSSYFLPSLYFRSQRIFARGGAPTPT